MNEWLEQVLWRVVDQLEPKPEEKKTEEKADAPKQEEDFESDDLQQRGRGARAGSGAGVTKKEYGSDLILRNTTGGTERTFNDVLDYTLSKDAKTLLFADASKKEETNGVYAVTPLSDAMDRLALELSIEA